MREPSPEAKQAAGMDARKWVEDFNQMEVEKGLQPTDPELMVTWFANAIMAGYDAATAKLREELHLAEQYATDNADWFNALRDELQQILGLVKNDEVSPIIGRVKQLARQQPSAKDKSLTMEKLMPQNG